MPDLPDMQYLSDSAAARMEPPFECTRTEGALEATWVHVAGALDVATTPRLARTLRESQSDARLVVLDLRELAFMDSAGVHAIVDASNRARQVGCRLLLLRGPEKVDRLFALTGNADQVEVGDLAPVESSFGPLQRALVSSSLLKTGGRLHGHKPSH
jgi:anti-sigma B factor antagonist